MTSSVASVSRLCQLLWLPVVFVVWFASNVAINLYNKWVLAKTDFHFPLTLSCTNKTVGWLGSLVVLKVAAMCGTASLPSLDSLLSQFKRPLVHAHGVTTAINIGLNNWSLVLISITLNQLIRSTVPLPTAVLSTLLEGRRYSAHVYASMCIVVLGVVLASSGALEASPLGLVLASLSVLSAATWGARPGEHTLAARATSDSQLPSPICRGALGLAAAEARRGEARRDRARLRLEPHLHRDSGAASASPRGAAAA